LWLREHERGEESGRKARPVCVQILFAGVPGGEKTLLFPITGQAPLPGVGALPLPETEARRVGLRTPAWIIVEEWHEDDLTVSDSIEDTQPLGAFSKTFVLRIREAAIAAIRSRRYRFVKR